MVAIIRMCMIMHAAGTVIQEMSINDKQYRWDKQPVLKFNKELFQDQEGKTGKEKDQGDGAVMMFPVSMKKGIATNHQGHADHRDLESFMVNEIDAKQR